MSYKPEKQTKMTLELIFQNISVGFYVLAKTIVLSDRFVTYMHVIPFINLPKWRLVHFEQAL